MASLNENPAPKEPQKADCPSASCCGSLVWKLSGEEWQAQSTPGVQYVAMPFDNTWHAFLFLGTRYKRGYTLASELATADEAKQICEKHHHE